MQEACQKSLPYLLTVITSVKGYRGVKGEGKEEEEEVKGEYKAVRKSAVEKS